jgi:hypothetical protein
MADNQKILDTLKTLEAVALTVIYECQQTRKLIEEDVSTPPKIGLSDIALKARMDLRAKILKPAK